MHENLIHICIYVLRREFVPLCSVIQKQYCTFNKPTVKLWVTETRDLLLSGILRNTRETPPWVQKTPNSVVFYFSD